MKCQSCGSDVNDTAKFCGACGKAISANEPTKEVAPKAGGINWQDLLSVQAAMDAYDDLQPVGRRDYWAALWKLFVAVIVFSLGAILLVSLLESIGVLKFNYYSSSKREFWINLISYAGIVFYSIRVFGPVWAGRIIDLGWNYRQHSLVALVLCLISFFTDKHDVQVAIYLGFVIYAVAAGVMPSKAERQNSP